MSGRYQPAMLKYFEQFSARNVCIVIQASMLEHKKQVNSASRWLVIIKMMLGQSIFLRTMMIVMMLKEKSFVSSEADQMDWVSKGCHLICCLAIDWKQTTSAVLITIITITTGTIIILYIQHYIQQLDNIPLGSQFIPVTRVSMQWSEGKFDQHKQTSSNPTRRFRQVYDWGNLNDLN